jgi:hypothetical protein
MRPDEIATEIEIELKKACKKFPSFPCDVVHAAAIVAEEAGELIQAALDLKYGRVGLESGLRKCVEEAAQTGAMVRRFLTNLNNYP